MKRRTWPILALGFGSLVLLTLLFGLDSWRRASQIYETILSIHRSHARAEQTLRDIESGIYTSGIFVRDYLLDPSQLGAGLYRQELLNIRRSMEDQLDELTGLLPTADPAAIQRLRRRVDAYWNSLDPLFDWTPPQKLAFSSLFLRRQVLPRRDAVLNMAREFKTLNAVDFAERQREMDRRIADFEHSGRRSLMLVVGLGLAVSAASILRISRLETRAERQHLATERAEHELRRLSQQLVRAQEDERRNLSRELHDEVGQTLTALRVELGNLEKLRAGSPETFAEHLEDAKRLAADTLGSVRNLAMGLRPAMLDDLGLGPALEWQAREFSRHTGVPVEVLLEGVPPNLPEAHRTCLYRVVQEALTNCARHADARRIRVMLHADSGRLGLTVEDDGRGLPEAVLRDGGAAGGGLGLVGIEERVHELGGAVALHSQPGKGTLLKVSIPLPEQPA